MGKKSNSDKPSKMKYKQSDQRTENKKRRIAKEIKRLERIVAHHPESLASKNISQLEATLESLSKTKSPPPKVETKKKEKPPKIKV